MDDRVGKYSFAIGVIIALILGLASSGLEMSTKTGLFSLLVILGIIVGLVNVTGKETKDFLLSAVVLIIAAAFGVGDSVLGAVGALGSLHVGALLRELFSAILMFTVPAVIVVALKNIWNLAKKR